MKLRLAKNPYDIDSVANALRSLTYLRDRGSAGVTDLAAHLGVARSTAHRLLSTLTSYGFVEHVANARSYRLGPEDPNSYTYRHSNDSRARQQWMVLCPRPSRLQLGRKANKYVFAPICRHQLNP